VSASRSELTNGKPSFPKERKKPVDQVCCRPAHDACSSPQPIPLGRETISNFSLGYEMAFCRDAISLVEPLFSALVSRSRTILKRGRMATSRSYCMSPFAGKKPSTQYERRASQKSMAAYCGRHGPHLSGNLSGLLGTVPTGLGPSLSYPVITL
jgi:hypothetical protein